MISGQEAEVGDIIPLSPPRVYDRESGNLIVRKGIQDQKPVRGGNHKSSAYQSDRGSHEATHMQGMTVSAYNGEITLSQDYFGNIQHFTPSEMTRAFVPTFLMKEVFKRTEKENIRIKFE